MILSFVGFRVRVSGFGGVKLRVVEYDGLGFGIYEPGFVGFRLFILLLTMGHRSWAGRGRKFGVSRLWVEGFIQGSSSSGCGVGV